MFGKKVKGIIPINKINNEIDYKEVKDRLVDKQNKYKEYYDASANDLKELKVNDEVYVRKKMNQPLESFNISKVCDRPRSYEVTLKNTGSAHTSIQK